MKHTWMIKLNKRNTVHCNYFADISTDTRCMRNTANFYIRNTMTGIRKSPEERTPQETEVLHDVFSTIHEREESVRMDIEEFRKKGGLHAEAGMKKILRKARFQYPTIHKWLLSYELLDAVFKHTENPVYKRMPSQVNQNAIRKTLSSWDAYMESIKEYRKNPGKFSGYPRIPGYIREDQATAWWTNQTAKMKVLEGKAFLQFVKCNEMLCIGSASRYAGLKYVKTEVKPAYGQYYIMVTMEDTTVMPVLGKNPARILGIDTGVDNFVAAAGNFGTVPFLIKGGAIKDANQWFNKKRAKLLSSLTKGSDSTHSQKNSRALFALSRKRSDFLRDFFYKCAWYICRYAEKYNVDVIVVGHNTNQKQNAGMGKMNNQAFVSIPFSQFISILMNTAAKCGIPVVTREESYTSKASLLDMDDIPVYKKDDKNVYTFSGIRTERGMYRSGDGMLINADINGAGNILRKEYPDAFHSIDMKYLYQSTDAVGYRYLYKVSPVSLKAQKKRHKRGYGSRAIHSERKAERLMYREVFPPEKKKNTAEKTA